MDPCHSPSLPSLLCTVWHQDRNSPDYPNQLKVRLAWLKPQVAWPNHCFAVVRGPICCRPPTSMIHWYPLWFSGSKCSTVFDPAIATCMRPSAQSHNRLTENARTWSNNMNCFKGEKKAGNLNKILSIIVMSVCCSCKVQDISFSQHFTQMAKFQAGKSLHNLGWNWKRRLNAPWFENMRQVKQDQLIVWFVWLPHGFVVICYDIMMFKKTTVFFDGFDRLIRVWNDQESSGMPNWEVSIGAQYCSMFSKCPVDVFARFYDITMCGLCPKTFKTKCWWLKFWLVFWTYPLVI